jgi:hypothetical protein
VRGALDWLELSTWSDRKAERACWATLRAFALNQLAKENDPLVLARAVLVFAETPSQGQAATSLARRLLAAVPIRPDGTPVLPEQHADERESRAIILAALVRTAEWWPAEGRALAGKLWARLRGERDVRGGYGSPEATRRVVTALLRAESPTATASSVRYTELSAEGKPLAQGSLALPANGTRTVTLSPATASVRIESSEPGLLARGERPLFRSYFRPVEPSQSPLYLDPSRRRRTGSDPCW